MLGKPVNLGYTSLSYHKGRRLDIKHVTSSTDTAARRNPVVKGLLKTFPVSLDISLLLVIARHDESLEG